jgi:hypothetical protein
MGAPTNVELNVVSMKAGGAVTANRVVKLDSTEGQVIVTTAITDSAFGVSLNTVASGAAVSIETGSGAIVKVTAGGTIAVGDKLMPKASAAGKVDVAAGATAVDCGVAMSAGGDGEIIVMRLNPMGKSPANS